jgi:hypothetical protein
MSIFFWLKERLRPIPNFINKEKQINTRQTISFVALLKRSWRTNFLWPRIKLPSLKYCINLTVTSISNIQRLGTLPLQINYYLNVWETEFAIPKHLSFVFVNSFVFIMSSETSWHSLDIRIATNALSQNPARWNFAYMHRSRNISWLHNMDTELRCQNASNFQKKLLSRHINTCTHRLSSRLFVVNISRQRSPTFHIYKITKMS